MNWILLILTLPADAGSAFVVAACGDETAGFPALFDRSALYADFTAGVDAARRELAQLSEVETTRLLRKRRKLLEQIIAVDFFAGVRWPGCRFLRAVPDTTSTKRSMNMGNDNAELNRRELLGVAALSAAALTLSSTAAAQEAAVAAPAFVAGTGLKPLAFDPARLNGLSERLIRSHWENNYGGSVRALAAVKQRLAAAAADTGMPAYLYNEIKREHLLRNGSVVLHEYYFDNLGGSGQAGANERARIAASFGSFDAWETEFRRIAGGLGGGSGWVVLGYNTHNGQLENFWMADHAHAPAATTPILVLDMYEHSYHIDFGAAAASYIDAFMQNVNWEVIAARLENLAAA